MQTPRLFLIDTYGFIFRAYHARARTGAPPMRTSTGLSTEVVFIFSNMLRKLTRTYSPDYMVAVFESLGKTHRETEYPEYKANRAETPDDLIQQVPYVRRLIDALRIPIIQYAGFEADDVIGTLSRQAAAAGCEVVIVSSDKDLLQLVTDRVHMLNPAKDDTWYDPAKVKEFMGVEPSQVADLLALKGDAVDNIPGAPGIGDKGAKDLIAQFGSVEAALDRTSEVVKRTYRESLEQNRERIELSKRLATVDCNVPVEFNLTEYTTHQPDAEQLKPLLKELEFFSQLKEFTESQAPSEDARPRDFAPLATEADLTAWLSKLPAPALDLAPHTAPASQTAATAIGPRPQGSGIPILSIALSTDATEIGLSYREGEARSIPINRLHELKSILENVAFPKSAADAKTLTRFLLDRNVRAAGFTDDPTLYAFLLDADLAGCSLEAMVERRLELKPGPRADERAAFTHELTERLRPELIRRSTTPPHTLLSLYEEIELPLASVLARMEHIGIRIDAIELARLSSMLETQIATLTRDIHSLAGCEFNISSPQQLGKILFETLAIPTPVKYGKGRVPSTAADILERLAPDHAIVRHVLEYRQLTKLKGTYSDALPALIDPATGRVHTSFNQTGAATGRLSSSNPNLQNIPIRTELGREIRAAFVPREGWQLIVADYSQIELRLLAHMSEDPVLVEAFRNGEDIHTRTAAEVLGVPAMLVTKEARNAAKAVNFGIVYGISGFGLAANLGIPRKEAETYIRGYFERYAGVKRFIDSVVAQTRETGIAKTLLGRERPIPDMNSRNPNARGFAERTAMNSPIQGTAADLIKLAMVRIDRKLASYRTKLLLQVHDELVLEAPPEEIDEVKSLVQTEMESVIDLKVPLVVDTGTGINWRDAK